MAGQLEQVVNDRNFQAVLRWVQEEMESHIRRGKLAPELKAYLQDCRRKLVTLVERLKDFIKEISNVWYHGNISSLSSGMAKFSAFCCCYGLSRSYARTLLKSIKRAKEQFDRFDTAASDLSKLCVIKIQNADEQKSRSGNSALWCVACVGGIVVGSILLGPLGMAAVSPSLAFGASGAVAAATGGGAATTAGIIAGAKGHHRYGQSKKIKEIQKKFEDIHKIVAKFKEIASLLMEKLENLTEQCNYLKLRSDGGSFVYRTMNSIFDKLEDVHEQADHAFPDLRKWTESAQNEYTHS